MAFRVSNHYNKLLTQTTPDKSAIFRKKVVYFEFVFSDRSRTSTLAATTIGDYLVGNFYRYTHFVFLNRPKAKELLARNSSNYLQLLGGYSMRRRPNQPVKIIKI